jgi:hypothetical protein
MIEMANVILLEPNAVFKEATCKKCRTKYSISIPLKIHNRFYLNVRQMKGNNWPCCFLTISHFILAQHGYVQTDKALRGINLSLNEEFPGYVVGLATHVNGVGLRKVVFEPRRAGDLTHRVSMLVTQRGYDRDTVPSTWIREMTYRPSNIAFGFMPEFISIASRAPKEMDEYVDAMFELFVASESTSSKIFLMQLQRAINDATNNKAT